MKYVFVILMLLQADSFKGTQIKQSRVKTSYEEKEHAVKKYFEAKQLAYAGFELFLRAFKQEKKLGVWVKGKKEKTYVLLHTYDFCTSSGTLGPKRKEGDLQIPEGVYHINHFNPQSNFYLSLGLNYPNASDKILSDKEHPGGSIYIHGNCVTVGCIPITDDKIKELYIMAVEARNAGQQKISVHVFPAKLTETGLVELTNVHPGHAAFWKNLKLVYDDFERTKKLQPVKINNAGKYFY